MPPSLISIMAQRDNSQPKGNAVFSVVVPVYNKRGALEPMLQSVLGQTFASFEVILVDDGSTDGGIDSIRDRLDHRCRVITQANGGVSKARNRGIREAQGRYIALLDADDCWFPDHLETAHAFFQQHPDIRWYCPSWTRSASAAAVLARVRATPRFEIHDYFASGHLAAEHPVWTSAVILAREAIGEQPLFPEHLCLDGEDLYAWYRVATVYPRFGWTPRVTVVYVYPDVQRPPRVRDLTVYVPQLLDDFPAVATPRNRCLRQHIELWLRDHLERGDDKGIRQFLRLHHEAVTVRFRYAWLLLAGYLAVFGTSAAARLLTAGLRMRRRWSTTAG